MKVWPKLVKRRGVAVDVYQRVRTLDVEAYQVCDGVTRATRSPSPAIVALMPHRPKQRTLGPAATTTYCWAPTLKVMGEAFMRTLVGNCHNVRPSR